MPSPLPSVRRVITGHNTAGKSIVLRDEVQKPIYWVPGSENAVHDFYRTSETPAVIDTELSQGEWVDEIARDPSLVSENGSTFRSVDFAPGSVSPLHRTISIDYGIVTKGSVVLELDDGKQVTVKEGDVIVQRGTIHAWKNESSEWARIYFILLDSQPVEVNGTKLMAEGLGSK